MNDPFKRTLVVFPARGGSKRIPLKNIKVINGQPMIYWPLRALRTLVKPENIIVSTDSEDIKKIIEKIGLLVPFMRPQNLSDDHTGIIDVVRHCLSEYEKNFCEVDFVLTIYPTAVLLKQDDLRSAMTKLISDTNCDSILAATNFAYPIQRAFFQNSMGYAQMFNPNNFGMRSQDLPTSYHDAGQFFISKAELIRQGMSLIDSNFRIHKVDRRKVIDIDTLEDFYEAEEKLKFYSNNFHLNDVLFNNE